MNWTLGRVASALLFGGLLAVMCAGYVGAPALLGAAMLVTLVGLVLLVVRIFVR